MRPGGKADNLLWLWTPAARRGAPHERGMLPREEVRGFHVPEIEAAEMREDSSTFGRRHGLLVLHLTQPDAQLADDTLVAAVRRASPDPGREHREERAAQQAGADGIPQLAVN